MTFWVGASRPTDIERRKLGRRGKREIEKGVGEKLANKGVTERSIKIKTIYFLILLQSLRCSIFGATYNRICNYFTNASQDATDFFVP